jgi:hypothetical protein
MKANEIPIGTPFGDWITLSVYDPVTKRILCRCVCQTVKSISAGSLINKDSTGCGCKAKEKRRQTRINQGDFQDLTGKRFGNWLVLSKSIAPNKYWVQCEGCQNVKKEVWAGSLLQGKSKGCNKCGVKQYRETMKKKYGEEHPLRLKEFKEKQIQTNLQRYEKENPAQNSIIKKKMESTLFLRHGVKNAMQCPKIRQKAEQTTLAKYGVKNILQSESVREKLLKESSQGEKDIQAFLHSLNIQTHSKICQIGDKVHQFDLYDDQTKIAIEYNGEYWHSESAKRGRNYHQDKNRDAETLGIRLIHIFELEWKSKKEQIKGFLKSAFGKNEIRIFARKCEIKKTEKESAREFLNQYHIQGAGPGGFHYGLFYDQALIAIMTISNHHRIPHEKIMSRWCVKNNITISGGLSRLIEFAMRDLNITEITTWADLRWSTGNGYLKSGWELISRIPPDYFYYDASARKIISKQSRRKSAVGTPPGMTEREHAVQDGLHRIWDCGKLKLCYRLKNKKGTPDIPASPIY